MLINKASVSKARASTAVVRVYLQLQQEQQECPLSCVTDVCSQQAVRVAGTKLFANKGKGRISAVPRSAPPIDNEAFDEAVHMTKVVTTRARRTGLLAAELARGVSDISRARGWAWMDEGKPLRESPRPQRDRKKSS